MLEQADPGGPGHVVQHAAHAAHALGVAAGPALGQSRSACVSWCRYMIYVTSQAVPSIGVESVPHTSSLSLHSGHMVVTVCELSDHVDHVDHNDHVGLSHTIHGADLWSLM